MANSLTNIMPRILAAGLISLRNTCWMPRLVNGDYSNEAAQKGTTIDVPVPVSVVTQDIVPSSTPVAPTDTTPGLVQVPLDQWKGNQPFYLTDKQMAEIDRNRHFLPMQAAEAISSISNTVNAYLLGLYKGVYGFAGTSGTTPFGTDAQAALDARRILNQQQCPMNDRRGVLDVFAEAAALKLQPFADAAQTGDNGAVKIDGALGRKYGTDWFWDNQVLTHTSTPLTAGAATINGAFSVGATTISIAKATNTSPLVKGDILTFAGDTQTYVVGADVTLAVGNTNVLIQPPLVVAQAGGAAVTLKATHVVNLVFQRNAIAFATRPLQASTADMELGSKILSMQDPLTGLVLRLEVSRQRKQVVWEFDVLYGGVLVRPQLACRIAG